MTATRITPRAGAAFAGALLIAGAAAGPALAYPAGSALTISCTPNPIEVGGTLTCILDNIDPNGVYTIEFGGLVSAGAVSAVPAGFAVGAVSETLTTTAPGTPGTYEVIGSDGTETATTEVEVLPTDKVPGGGATTPPSSGGSTGSGPTTPETGSGNVALGLVAGLGALGLGGGLILASRRKA